MILAVYGTLRRGDNNDHFLNGCKLLSTERVEGFEMYNLRGSYPYIARGADSITVEVYDVSPETLVPIERMERGAGYDMVKCKTSQGIGKIFCMTEKVHAELQTGTDRPPKIVSGDWFEWLRNYRPDRLFELNNVYKLGMRGDGDASIESWR